MVIGIVLGIVVAVMRLSPNPIVSTIAWLYAWFFRGTPVLVQVIFWSFIAILYPVISLGIPFGPEFVYFDSNLLIPIFVGAVLGFGLNEAAYMSEIVRAGILSVDSGQTEAAEALGMTRLKILRRIVLPQAMRVIIPPTGNETISMLKTTSHRQRHRGRRPVHPGPADLRRQPAADPAAGRGEHLVPGADLAAVDRPVLHRTPVLPRHACPPGRAGFFGFGRPKSGMA